MRIDGRAVAADILARVRERVRSAEKDIRVRAVVVAPTKATESYLRIKSARANEAGMTLLVERLPDTALTEDVIAAVVAEGADAVIVQLPLPEHIDTVAVLEAIPFEKDADCLSTQSRIDGACMPPVAGAVHEILVRTNVAPAGMRAVVVGEGWLVGEPVATYLREAGAVVEVVTKQNGNLRKKLRGADIVVSGAGAARIIEPNMLRKGVVLIDAGTSESGGAIAGDADPACERVAAVFTPVPGGVGPIAVAKLFENVANTVLSRG